MGINKSRFLSVMVIGNNPEQLMEKYNKSLKVKPYIKYKYLDAKKLKTNAAKLISELVSNTDKIPLNSTQLNYFKERLNAINSMTSFEYYKTLTEGMYYDEDGNAMSEENPNGKWDKYNIGKNFSYPLKLKDGKEVYQSLAKDVEWDEMHMNHEYVKLFETIWALVMYNEEPSTKEEENLKANWLTKKNYLSNFKDVDAFVSHNCAYWNYAVLTEDGWKDLGDNGNESEWVNGFFERFIEPLKGDELITIYEYCTFE